MLAAGLIQRRVARDTVKLQHSHEHRHTHTHLLRHGDLPDYPHSHSPEHSL